VVYQCISAFFQAIVALTASVGHRQAWRAGHLVSAYFVHRSLLTHLRSRPLETDKALHIYHCHADHKARHDTSRRVCYNGDTASQPSCVQAVDGNPSVEGDVADVSMSGQPSRPRRPIDDANDSDDEEEAEHVQKTQKKAKRTRRPAKVWSRGPRCVPVCVSNVVPNPWRQMQALSRIVFGDSGRSDMSPSFCMHAKYTPIVMRRHDCAGNSQEVNAPASGVAVSHPGVHLPRLGCRVHCAR
jgi:hypothetical protein